MAGKYVMKKTSNGEFMFNLKAGNGEVILTSERYTSKGGCENGIQSVQTNGPKDSQYDRRESSNGKPYFVLKAGNGEIIGKSEMYNSSSAMENGIRSVKENSTTNDIDDQT